jgi:hypothetical protein
MHFTIRNPHFSIIAFISSSVMSKFLDYFPLVIDQFEMLSVPGRAFHPHMLRISRTLTSTTSIQNADRATRWTLDRNWSACGKWEEISVATLISHAALL